MPVRKITEQQFRTRRKDRKMVWVDAAALLVGLLVLSVSVGGIIVIEPDPEPIAWTYSFPEGKVTQRWCAGVTGIKEGCQQVDRKITPEGETITLLLDPVTVANATEVVFSLTWVDNTPDMTKDEHKDKDYPYDGNSTDTLRVDVTSPWGESFSADGTNDLDLKSGLAEIRMNISAPPEPGTMKALEKRSVQNALAATHTDTEHDALGDWVASVTVVRSGDQNGTLPKQVCGDVPPDAVEALPDQVKRECYFEDRQNSLEGYGLRAVPNYRSTYDDTGNMWILEFAVRTYSASVSF